MHDQLHSARSHKDDPQHRDRIFPDWAKLDAPRERAGRRGRMRLQIEQWRREQHYKGNSPDREPELRTNAGAEAESDRDRGDEGRALPDAGNEYVGADAKELGKEIQLCPFRFVRGSFGADSACAMAALRRPNSSWDTSSSPSSVRSRRSREFPKKRSSICRTSERLA